jgi:uncharacterized protein YkwD
MSAFGLVAALTLPALGGLRACTPSCAPPPPPPAVAAIDDCVGLTNQQRTANGLPPLNAHATLQAVAEAHSVDQATMARMSHTGSDGSTVGTRLTRAGFVWGVAAENVAGGQPDCAAVVGAWMNSSGHRANILGPTVTLIGVAMARAADGTPYWTMVLAA